MTFDPDHDPLIKALRRHRLAPPPPSELTLGRARAAWGQEASSGRWFWPLLIAAAVLALCDWAAVQVITELSTGPYLPQPGTSAVAAHPIPGLSLPAQLPPRLTVSALEHRLQELHP